jgi:PAS domain-containing protein
MRRKSAGKATLAKHRKAVTKKLLSVNSFLDSLPETIIFSLDTQYRYTAFSEAHAVTMKKIWGVSITKGMNMLEAISGRKDRNKAKKNFDQALKGKHFVRIEDYGDPDHLRTSYEDRYGPIRDKAGEIIGLYVWVVDLTRYRKTESEVKHYSALLTSSLESVNHGILVLDLERNIIFRNQQFQTLFNIPKALATSGTDEKIMNWVLEQVVTTPEFMNRIQSIMDDVETESFERMHLKDGRIFNRLTKPHRLNGQIIGRVWSFQV